MLTPWAAGSIFPDGRWGPRLPSAHHHRTRGCAGNARAHPRVLWNSLRMATRLVAIRRLRPPGFMDDVITSTEKETACGEVTEDIPRRFKTMNEFVTKQIVAAQALVAKLRERAEEGQGMVEYALILAF